MEQHGSLKALLDTQTYLDKYLPLPSPTLSKRVLDSLKKVGMYKADVWVKIPRKIEDEDKVVEGDIYKGFVDVLEKIRDFTEKDVTNIDRVRGKWIDTHDRALQTPSGFGVSGLRPDVSFVHDETGDTGVFWSRAYSVIEVKVEDVKTSSLGAQLSSYVGHIFAEQVDRLFVNALTLSGHKLRVWRYDRSGFIILDNAIDIDKDPLKFVQIIASFSYLPPIDLGWDPTCTIWNRKKQVQEPSYKLPQKLFQQCGVYDLPWVFEVEEEFYVAIGPVSGNRSLSVWGRATFVVHAVELEHWKDRNGQAKVYILKQCWQRLPGLGCDPKTAEIRNGDSNTPDQADRDSIIKQFEDIDRKPFEAFIMERVGWKDRIKASWNVELDGEPITTFTTIRKNLATFISPPIPPSRGTSRTGKSSSKRGSALKGSVDTIDNAPGHPALVTRRLVRLVFDRPGWPIERFSSKLELLYSLKSIVEELEKLHKSGVVHRDVSPSNLIISDSGGHIIDYDHSKVGFVKGVVLVKKTRSKDVVEIATKILGDELRVQLYITQLKMLWGIQAQAATPEDFHWPEEIGPVYLFDNRRAGNGFITGTYEFVSPYLLNAPFHHGGHDLDALWWSINIIPLMLEGPGGRKRQNLPEEVIHKYYGSGFKNKGRLMQNFRNGGDYMDAMMAEYSDYFEDLKPFMKKWALFLPIALDVKSYEHYHPHHYLLKIIDKAIQGINEKRDKGEVGYENDAKEELLRREKEKAYMAEAICEQITVPILPKLEDTAVAPVVEISASTPSSDVTNSASFTATAPLSPERNPISLTTVASPERDRAVKRARSGTYIRNATD